MAGAVFIGGALSFQGRESLGFEGYGYWRQRRARVNFLTYGDMMRG